MIRVARQEPDEAPPLSCYFALAAGLFLVVAFLKWGNLPVIEQPGNPLPAPGDALETIYWSWPIHWAYWAMIPIGALGLAAFVLSPPLAASARSGFHWAIVLPLLWLVWQFVSALQSVSGELSSATLLHFTICVGVFYVGFVGLRHRDTSRIVWACLAMGLLCVLQPAFKQHFGGLEETRQWIHNHPELQNSNSYINSPSYLKRLASNRVFGLMFYANSLAGAILLLMPVALGFTWLNAQRLSSVARWSAVAIVAVASLSILYWTGSKSAWLLTVVIGLTALWHTQIKTRWKAWLTGGFVILSLTGFALKHAGFFEKGATSVVARFDYWKAAVRIAGQHPIVGSGPGTFSIGYRRIKSPEAEFAMLCHNDYLEQACDSGLPGATAYTAFWILTLVALYKASRKNSDLMAFAAWLGLLGFFMHSFVEFHLYIPALSWTAFFLLGWAWSAAGPGRQASQRDPI